MNERSLIALLKRAAPAVAFIFRLETMFVEKILLCLFGSLCRVDKEPFYSRRMITMRSNVVLVERVRPACQVARDKYFSATIAMCRDHLQNKYIRYIKCENV